MVSIAKLFQEDLFFNANAIIRGCQDNGETGQRTRPRTKCQVQTKKNRDHTRISRMPDPTVWTIGNKLVAALDLDHSREKTSQLEHGPGADNKPARQNNQAQILCQAGECSNIEIAAGKPNTQGKVFGYKDKNKRITVIRFLRATMLFTVNISSDQFIS